MPEETKTGGEEVEVKPGSGQTEAEAAGPEAGSGRTEGDAAAAAAAAAPGEDERPDGGSEAGAGKADEDASQDDAEVPGAGPAEPEGEPGAAGAAPATSPVEGERPPATAEEIKGWAGFKLDDLAGHSVGRVEGVYVDDAGGRAEWLLARMGRFGHHTLVPARDAVAAAGRVWVPYSRDQIRKAPRVNPGEAIERDREQALLDHYGVGTGEAGRGAELAARGPSAVTARPA